MPSPRSDWRLRSRGQPALSVRRQRAKNIVTHSPSTRTGVTKERRSVLRRTQAPACDACALKPELHRSSVPARKNRALPIHEAICDKATCVLARTEPTSSCAERRRSKMLFAHLKRILGLDRIAHQEVKQIRRVPLFAATAQNLRKRGRETCPPPLRRSSPHKAKRRNLCADGATNQSAAATTGVLQQNRRRSGLGKTRVDVLGSGTVNGRNASSAEFTKSGIRRRSIVEPGVQRLRRTALVRCSAESLCRITGKATQTSWRQ